MELRDAGPVDLAIRRAKVTALAARRLARWLVEPGFAAPERVTPTGPTAHVVRMPIARAGADPRLDAGKRHNVRLAATAFHGVVITPERPLSFWRTLGPATAARGFAWGMEVRAGCAVPAIGGGLCLVSNALFALAAELGWRVLERHGHTLALAEPGALDATVAFPYVDLRVAPRTGRAILDVAVRGDVLVVAARHDGPALRVELDRGWRDDGATRTTQIRRRVWDAGSGRVLEDAMIANDRQRVLPVVRTCLDCGQTACHARVDATGGAAPRPTGGAGVAPTPLRLTSLVGLPRSAR
jgi:vancomycin resistance protein VanW